MFRALWPYIELKKNDLEFLEINFSYKNNNNNNNNNNKNNNNKKKNNSNNKIKNNKNKEGFVEYGNGNNSLVNRWIQERKDLKKYWQKVQNSASGLNEEEKVIADLTQKQKQNLENFFSEDLFDFDKTITTAVKRCLLNFEKKDDKNRFKLMKTKKSVLNEFHDILNKYENKGLIKLGGELTTIINCWLHFFSTSGETFFTPQKLEKVTDKIQYVGYFRHICRVLANYSVLMVSRNRNTFNVKETVELIDKYFTLKPKFQKMKELYMVYCVTCFGCYQHWLANPSVIRTVVEKSPRGEKIRNELTEAILFKEHISEAVMDLINNEVHDVRKFEGVDKVVNDLKNYFNEKSRFKNLIEDYGKFIDETFKNWRENNRGPSAECLLEKYYGCNFMKKESKFIIGLLEERIAKCLTDGKLEPIEKGLENHQYNEGSGGFINEFYMRRKSTSYYRKIIQDIDDDFWPAVTMDTHKDSSICSSLFSGLDIFSDDKKDAAIDTLLKLSSKDASHNEKVQMFNKDIFSSFDRSKLLSCFQKLFKLANKNRSEKSLQELISKKSQKLAESAEDRSTEQPTQKNADKNVTSVEKRINDPNKTSIKSNKRKNSGVVDQVPEKRKSLLDEKTEEHLKNNKITDKSEPMDGVSETGQSESKLKIDANEDDSFKKKTDDFMKDFMKKCLENPLNMIDNKLYDEMYKKTVNNDVKQFSKCFDDNKVIDNLNKLVKETKAKLKKIQNYKELFDENKTAIQESLNDEILRELCLFYWKYLDEPEKSIYLADELSNLSKRLVNILDDFIKQPFIKIEN